MMLTSAQVEVKQNDEAEKGSPHVEEAGVHIDENAMDTQGRREDTEENVG